MFQLRNEQWLYLTLAVTFFIKLGFAFSLPLTGDEAYFIAWANHLDYGYYDHPPMVGWLLAAFMQVSDALTWIRLPTILITSLIGWAIFQLIKEQNPLLALYCAALYLVAPINLVGVLITTDTPLILFSFLSALSFYRAQERDSYGWYLSAGVFLGLAFYSKFFAAIVGIAFLIYLILFARRGGKPFIGIAIVVAGTLPFIALNLLWNYNNCWDNYLFNLQNRTGESQISLTSPLIYLATLLYLLTPPLFYYAAKQYRSQKQQLKAEKLGVFFWLFLIPIALFAFLSIKVEIGLHWLLGFYPFAFLSLALLLNEKQLRNSLYFMLLFSALHIVLFAFILMNAPQIFAKNDRLYSHVVYATHIDTIAEKLQPYRGKYQLSTTDYAMSAMLAYATKEEVIVFGSGSHHGRQDDINTDFRMLIGADILLFSRLDKLDQYRKYFTKYEMFTLKILDQTFYYALGDGFNYALYRQEILSQIKERYYNIPDSWPDGVCYFHTRYFE